MIFDTYGASTSKHLYAVKVREEESRNWINWRSCTGVVKLMAKSTKPFTHHAIELKVIAEHALTVHPDRIV